MITLAERIEEKGIEKDVEKEKIEIAIKLLNESANPVFVAKITGLSISKIKTL